MVAGAGGLHLLGGRPAGEHDHAASGAAGATGAQTKKPQFQCPMHPTITSDHPSDCPICGMKLVPMETGAPANPTAPAERRIALYRSPMDPKQTSPAPRKDEMGMDYLPVYQDELDGTGSVEGLATIKIDTDRQQLIGLTSIEASIGPIGGSLRTTGRVVVDETRVHHLNVKFSGFAEHVHADFIGHPVKKGDPLFSIYSPDLLASEEEFILALNTRAALSAAKGLASNGDDLVAAARRKLELLDVSADVIDQLEKTRKAERTITIRSPAAGVVVKKDVVPGMKVEAGAMPYEIVDLSSIWVLADVYETELRRVKVGSAATLLLKAIPDQSYRGRVAFIDPYLDPKTRSAKVRIAVSNPGYLIKPEMYGEVVLRTPSHQAVRVPPDAVIHTGTTDVVFLSLGDGKFQPRHVHLGDDDGQFVEVVSGLNKGDKIVTRANFLVDSESRLKASLQALGGGR
jgi:Cu(I)/Ag(I) efflux system membrane fusion protein